MGEQGFIVFGVHLCRSSIDEDWGLECQPTEGKKPQLRVTETKTDSPASMDIKVGDIITEINGISCDDLIVEDVMAVFKSSKTDLELKVKRGANEDGIDHNGSNLVEENSSRFYLT